MNGYALIIGNTDYILDRHKLVNAVNDAQDISKTLNSLGFTVRISTNVDTDKFSKELIDFSNELQNYDVALFYYSGHGFQIENINYLTAIDSRLQDATSAKNHCFKLDEILERMISCDTKIVILDACRDNPFDTTRSLKPLGLAPVYAPTGTLIAFSTSPGETANDSGHGRNSIYTNSLLSHILDKNIQIEEFFKRVRTSVHSFSKGKQTSWEHTSLIGSFEFNSGLMAHSVHTSYPLEYIADANFKSSGSEFDEIIRGLKIQDWYTQKDALKDFFKIPVKDLNEKQLFLFGRNILQTAIGGEFAAQSFFENLSHSLKKYSTGNENHVLNGILYEIYFNSEGKYRGSKFKTEFISEVYLLQQNPEYIKSFEFIIQQIEPLRDFVYYIPTIPAKSCPIDIVFIRNEFSKDKVEIEEYLTIESIKIYSVEAFNSPNARIHMLNSSKRELEEKLSNELGIPKELLNVSYSLNPDDFKFIELPWNTELIKSKSV